MKKLFFAFCVIITVLLFMFVAYGDSVSALTGDVSPAINVLREETVLHKCGVCGEIVSFARTDYENALGTELRYITVTSLPDEAAGTLKLNGISVVSGQTIAASSLNYLTFTPAGGEAENVSFTFRCDAEGWEYCDITCAIMLSASRNTSPVLSSGAFSTVRNAMTEYRLELYEPDGDDVEYRVDEYPASGSISIKDGMLIYTPVKGFTGNDSMVITAVDEYGNLSAAANIDITVGKSGIVFSDMSDSPAHAAAIALAENSIVTYVYKDGEYLYNPDQSVTRIDFLVMLMASADVDVTDAGTTLPFSDTTELNDGRKAYLAKAIALGVVVSDETEFRPKESVIRSEAAVWVTKLLGLTGSVSAFTDTVELDVETAAYISAAVKAGIFTAKNDAFMPNDEIDREEAARVLIKVMEN